VGGLNPQCIFEHAPITHVTSIGQNRLDAPVVEKIREANFQPSKLITIQSNTEREFGLSLDPPISFGCGCFR